LQNPGITKSWFFKKINKNNNKISSFHLYLELRSIPHQITKMAEKIKKIISSAEIENF